MLKWFAIKDGSCKAFEVLNKNIVLGSDLRPLRNFLGLREKELTRVEMYRFLDLSIRPWKCEFH